MRPLAKLMRSAAAVVLACSGGMPLLTATEVHAQAQGVTAKPLLRSSLSGDESKESVILAIEFAPGATTGRHVHPGDEFATVLEGTLELRPVGGEPRRVGAGQAYHNPRGLVHETVNLGPGIARTVATFIIDKGQPITVPHE